MKHATFTSEGASKTIQLRHLLEDLLKFRLDIENALCYASGSHTFDDVADMVITGRCHFYSTKTSFVIMELLVYPQHKVYHTFLAGGNLQEVLSLHEKLNANAKALECKYTSVVGRRGWVKALKAYGWKEKFTTLYREVD